MAARKRSRKSLSRGARTRDNEDQGKSYMPIPRYLRIVDRYRSMRIDLVLAEFNDAFSVEQIEVYNRWKQHVVERAKEAALRAAESRRLREESNADRRG